MLRAGRSPLNLRWRSRSHGTDMLAALDGQGPAARGREQHARVVLPELRLPRDAADAPEQQLRLFREEALRNSVF
jgi:hypothetical protein